LAQNGEEGLVQAKAILPNIILLDVMMPKRNGLELLNDLKADATIKDIPVIMLTNLADESDQESAISKGAVKYLIKSEHEPAEIVKFTNEVLLQFGIAPPVKQPQAVV